MVPLDNNNQDAKRLKMEQNGVKMTPSKVIHIRNIPNDVTEAEIIHLGIPFGRVTNVLVLKGKNQAFLEMEEEPSAVAMVNYFTNCVAQLRERSVYVQFSNHTALKTDQVRLLAAKAKPEFDILSPLCRLTATPRPPPRPLCRPPRPWPGRARSSPGVPTPSSGSSWSTWSTPSHWTSSFRSSPGSAK